MSDIVAEINQRERLARLRASAQKTTPPPAPAAEKPVKAKAKRVARPRVIKVKVEEPSWSDDELAEMVLGIMQKAMESRPSTSEEMMLLDPRIPNSAWCPA